jgi:LysM repeat protein
MVKVIKLTESDLHRIVRRVINEQMNTQTPIEVQMTKVVPEKGGKYCFGGPQKVKSMYGDNVKLYKVKPGDTLSGIVSRNPGTGSVEEIMATNRICTLQKGVKAGDVLALVLLPSM